MLGLLSITPYPPLCGHYEHWTGETKERVCSCHRPRVQNLQAKHTLPYRIHISVHFYRLPSSHFSVSLFLPGVVLLFCGSFTPSSAHLRFFLTTLATEVCLRGPWGVLRSSCITPTVPVLLISLVEAAGLHFGSGSKGHPAVANVHG